MTNFQLPFGGEIWHQRDFPCFSVYVITGRDGMALLADPRELGSCIHRFSESREWWWTQQELASHLHRLKYTCEGQLYDILLDWKYGGHFDQMREMGRSDPRRFIPPAQEMP